MVRQDNVSLSNQPTILITPHSFDKRALTTTDPLSLAHSLLNLSQLTLSCPSRIFPLLSTDGTLHLLIRHLSRLFLKKTELSRLSYSAIISILCTMAVRGNQALRSSLLHAQVLLPLIQLLEASIRCMQASRKLLGLFFSLNFNNSKKNLPLRSPAACKRL